MQNNPFVITGYNGPEYFCNRHTETERLLSAIHNHRNITLYSLRRMGKTGLIFHTFHQPGIRKNTITVYADVLPALDLAEFTTTLSRAILSKLAQKQSAIKKLITSLASLRPTLTYDPLTGKPEISVKIETPTQAEHSMETLFQLLSTYTQHFIIAIDEFQQIAYFKEKNAEAILRSHIQKHPNISFIFSGSQRHTLSEIFSLPNRPFFNSTEIMEIGPIEATDYFAFIASHFQKSKRIFTPEAFLRLQKLTDLHTFFVQFICNRLYGSKLKTINESDTEAAFRQIVAENENIYANYMRLITATQFKVLKALAKDQGESGITSRQFLTTHRLGAASSVKTAVNSLLEKDFIYQTEKGYELIDKFFKGWLRNIDF